MIDFTECIEELNNYKGSEKKKIEKINYMEYMKSMKNEECNKAIHRVFKRINIEQIKKFIEQISCISDVRKDFYKKIIELRYEIIKNVYDIIDNFNKSKKSTLFEK